MNINPIQVSAQHASFGCNNPKCECCVQCVPQQPVQDTVELSGFQKAKNACKKGFSFVKNNKSAIGTTLASATIGLLTSCTILGANQLMSKVSKTDTSALAAKLAAIGGIVAGATNLIKHKDVFKKQNNDVAK